LLEGLEAVEIRLSDVFNNNQVFRTDAEYFNKNSLYLLSKIEKIGYKKIDDVAYVTDGIHTSIDYCESSIVNLISAGSPKENIFDLSKNHHISEKSHNLNIRTALKLEDVIISTVGTNIYCWNNWKLCSSYR
jgi:hypothetical protein